MVMLKIGLTGGIGAGKSTVAGLLGELGIKVVDADQLAHRFYAKGTAGFDAIVARFGTAVVDEQGEIARAKLRQIAFQDESAKRDLERLVWPFVVGEIERIAKASEAAGIAVLVVEAALLFDADWAMMFDKIWIVEAPFEAVSKRMRELGRTQDWLDEAKRNQASDADRRTMAEKFEGEVNFILNDGDVGELRQKILDLVQGL